MSTKDYRGWMPVKANINNNVTRRKGYHPGEVWWVSIGDNVGYEEDGKGDNYARPVLVLAGFG